MEHANKKSANKSSSKVDDLSVDTENGAGQLLTNNQGLKINDKNNSLKAGERGPTLLEDFILREKTTHFDHERIPERIVHARGSGAHGIFKLYEPLDKYTENGNHLDVDGSFLTDASVLYDAVYIPDGKKSIAALKIEPNSVHFVNEAYKHCKAIATGADGAAFLKETYIKEFELNDLNMEEAGMITDGNADKFIACIAGHRFWNREEIRKVRA